MNIRVNRLSNASSNRIGTFDAVAFADRNELIALVHGDVAGRCEPLVRLGSNARKACSRS